MKHLGKPMIQSHEKAFFNGSLEGGLGSLSGNMGWSLMDDFIKPIVNQATASTPTQPAPAVLPAPKKSMTMTYVKYGAFAIGGVVLLALAMKMMKKKA
jgi:hypothetical protein